MRLQNIRERNVKHKFTHTNATLCQKEQYSLHRISHREEQS